MSDNTEAVRKHREIIEQADLFSRHITDLEKKIGGLNYLMIATDDGFPVASTKMDEMESMRKAAITASLEGLGNTVAYESNLKEVEATYIESANGYIISRAINLDEEKHVALLLCASRKENLATLLWHIKNMTAELISDFAAAQKA